MKYKLANGQRKMPLVGLLNENRNGTNILHKVPFVFKPGCIVDTGEYDLSAWVEIGIAVEVKEEAAIKDTVIETAVEEVVEPEPVVEASEVEEPVTDEPEEEVNDYIEKDDGFECLHCGKKYKRESNMIKHVESHKDGE